VGGECECKVNVAGRRCDTCKDGYYNLQTSNPTGCQACDCLVSGTVNASVTCDAVTGQCHCKHNVQGLLKPILCWCDGLSVLRILVRGFNAPMPPEAKFFFSENLTTKWCILKYI